MKGVCEYVGRVDTIEGETLVAFSVSDKVAEQLESMEAEKVVLEVTKFYDKRSNNANAYFWKLCQLIAEKTLSTQDEVHDLMLYRYGQRGVLSCRREELHKLEKTFDLVQILDEYDDLVECRVFVGSRFYDKAEMSRLIEGTYQDAVDYGIDVIDKGALNELVERWANRNDSRR